MALLTVRDGIVWHRDIISLMEAGKKNDETTSFNWVCEVAKQRTIFNQVMLGPNTLTHLEWLVALKHVITRVLLPRPLLSSGIMRTIKPQTPKSKHYNRNTNTEVKRQ